MAKFRIMVYNSNYLANYDKPEIKFMSRPEHNNQINKEALRAPIIQDVMCFEASDSDRKRAIVKVEVRE